MWGKCKLCGNHRMLIKRSHIIPNFMYSGLRDELNRFSFVSLKTYDRGKLMQSGIYESGILCTMCENHFSKMEDYAKRVLYGGRQITIQGLDKNEIPGVLVSGLHYINLKLFVLSILWRSHISKHHFFKYVDLKGDEKTIGKMLLSEDVGQVVDFRICILAIKTIDNNLLRIVTEPTIFQLETGRIAYFFIDGFIYFIAIDKTVDLAIMSNYSLNEKGELKIPILAGLYGRKTLLALGLPEEFVNYFIPNHKA